MNPQEHINSLQELIRKSNEFKVELSEVAVKEMEGLMKQRIFNDGLDSSNNKIGKYSTTSIYMRTSQFPKNKPSGKGKRFEGGYAEFREAVGRQNNYVDLQLSDELFRSIHSFKMGDKWVVAIQNQNNIDKAEGNEDRFKTKIFEPSQEENDKINESITKQIIKIIRRNV